MPKKLGFIKKSREVLDLWLLRLPFPNINPSIISVLAIPSSIAFVLLWDRYRLIAFIFLIITLCFDWLDGIIAKKYNRTSEKGWLIDTLTDRISEGIIFLKFFHPWFYLFLANVILNIVVFRLKKYSIILPLRQFFTLYLVLYYSFYYFFT